MIQDSNNALHYNAEEGNTFVQKGTNIRYGNDLYLSIEDSIDNYSEEPMTDEEKAEIEAKKQSQEQGEKTSKKAKK